ncbi:MAG: glycoside hydrolase family 16 protein [Marmoricola sp.]
MTRRRWAGLLAGAVTAALVATGVVFYGGASSGDAATLAASTTAVPGTGRGWHRIFDDEFNGTRLNPRKWRTRIQPRVGNRQCSQPRPGMVRVHKGHVVLRIKKVGRASKACPHGLFANAMIGTGENTVPGFTARYGLFAARVKFQRGRGQHGSFWMQSAETNGAEIDVAEYFGDGRSDGGISNFVHRTRADGTVHSVGGVRRNVKRFLGRRHTPANGWHIWSVQWTPRHYVFRVDGHVTMKTSRARVSTREFMVLSLLTSDWELPALNTTSSTMQVDWVRAWKR